MSCKTGYAWLLVLHCLSWTLGSSLSFGLSLFYRYCFGRYSSELAQLVSFPYSRGRSTRYSDGLHDFSVTILRCYKDVLCQQFFWLWNSLPIEYFPLIYDLNHFKSRINRHLLTVDSFLKRFPIWFNLFVFLFLVTPCLIVAVQSCMEWIPI